MDLGRVFTQKDFGSITVGKIKERLILGNPETKTVHTKLCVFFTGQRWQRNLRSVTKIAFVVEVGESIQISVVSITTLVLIYQILVRYLFIF